MSDDVVKEAAEFLNGVDKAMAIKEKDTESIVTCSRNEYIKDLIKKKSIRLLRIKDDIIWWHSTMRIQPLLPIEEIKLLLNI